ncbi:ProQ/FINO family protein [Methylibium sp.]|uniref:ProQ/FINO family protein n=1 Tax=Methylibium sp. TaxID=2067992 RepID=UPI0026002451|nr:ProQ/FINO family protein [Methylibium sp.]
MTEDAMPATESSAQAAGATEGPAAASTKNETETEAASPAVADLSPSACAARLAELFPAVFSPGAPKPLKLRIQADVQQRAPGVFTRKALSVFLHRHTTSTAYLRALADAADRIDLDGLPAGPVNDEHRQAAATELQRRRALHDERRAAERDAQRKAHDERRAGERDAQRAAHDAQRAAHDAQRATHDEARRARAAEGQALSERAALLRAFEATTLTAANFCALKGLSQGDLATALAQARDDRQRFAQAPRPQPPETRPPDRDPRTRSQPPEARPAQGEPRTAHRQQPDRRARGAPKPPR